MASKIFRPNCGKAGTSKPVAILYAGGIYLGETMPGAAAFGPESREAGGLNARTTLLSHAKALTILETRP